MKQAARAASRAGALVLVCALAFGQTAAYGWGSNGHVYANRVAAENIPASMPKFLRTKAAITRIAYLGPEPDRWRAESPSALNNAQAPDHFIDLERIESFGDLPMGRYDFYKLLYAKRAAAGPDGDQYLPERVGLQPYIAMEIFDRLEIAFREYRSLREKRQKTDAVENDIIFYMGWLGHYAADASQPLHTTVNYDGWVEANPNGYTTQHGIHALFESDFVDRTTTAASFAGLVNGPQRLEKPFGDYVKYLWATHALAPQVYQFEKAKAFDGAGSPEAVKFVRERLAAGSQMLLNLWYTAWLKSGEPLHEPASKTAN